MKLTVEFVRKQLEHIKPLINSCSISASRAAQEAIGKIITHSFNKQDRFDRLEFKNFVCGLITPLKSNHPDAAIIYIHGGGYTSGGLEYAKGFAHVLANITGLRVFCPSYRLAPENKFPAALQDCLAVYRYVTECVGILPSKLILCGESAGGGIIYSICLKLKEIGETLPAGIVAISPWTDLTLSADSYQRNKKNDPSMTRERLDFFADCYLNGKNRKNPFVSPIFGDLRSFPPSLIFSGGDEIMLDDAVELNSKLLLSKSESLHIIKPSMWHAYVVYMLDENKEDIDTISNFIKDRISDEAIKMDEAR